MRETWCLVAFRLMEKRLAMCLLLQPASTARATCSSRGVSPKVRVDLLERTDGLLDMSVSSIVLAGRSKESLCGRSRHESVHESGAVVQGW